tara:strand:+ start:7743 stop:8006 length:264 start_codon:yes stop_codon:yes gene_type:complete
MISTHDEFDVGDLVRRRTDIYREGIVLATCEDVGKRNFYYVIFFVGTQYLCQPSVELFHRDELVIIQKQIHKASQDPKFKKIKKAYH